MTSTPTPEYVVTGTLKRDGRYFRPGDRVVITDPEERERLLRLGAIREPLDFVRRTTPRPTPV